MRPLCIGIIKRAEEVLADECFRDLHREGVLDGNRIHERRADRRKHRDVRALHQGAFFRGHALHVEIKLVVARGARGLDPLVGNGIFHNEKPAFPQDLNSSLEIAIGQCARAALSLRYLHIKPHVETFAALVPLRFALCGLSVVTPLMEDNSSRSTRPRLATDRRRMVNATMDRYHRFASSELVIVSDRST